MDLPNTPQRRGRKATKIVATYDYTDEFGALLFQVVRLDPKTSANGGRLADDPPQVKNGWVWSVKGVRQVLYRLPELIEALALERRVFIVEGEKDVDTLARYGITATCNAGGAGKWRDEFAELSSAPMSSSFPTTTGRPRPCRRRCPLARRQGRARPLARAARPTRKGDVTDWFATGGTVEDFNALVDSRPAGDGSGDRCRTCRCSTSPPGTACRCRRAIGRCTDRIARRNVTLLSGEGGVGKSILILQLAAAHVLARDWFGTMPEPGPVIYLNAEDDERELHFRLDAIRAHLGTTFAALKDLHLVPLAGEDALLGAPDRAGIIQPTPLFERVREPPPRCKPVLIALDTAADMFGGNENDRSQVRQFIGLLRGLAIAANAGVLLASHPSLSGINTDSGLSGSTGWHNSVRSRLYFKAAKAADGEKPNPDLRELEVRKNNYGPSGEVIRMRWQNGVFVPVSAPSSLEKMAAERDAEDVFLRLARPLRPHRPQRQQQTGRQQLRAHRLRRRTGG